MILSVSIIQIEDLLRTLIIKILIKKIQTLMMFHLYRTKEL